MGRKAREAGAGLAMHVWQRGNHRETVFASDAEHRLFLSILFTNAAAFGMSVFGYCLMKQQYAVATHRKMDSSGHLWHGRFGSKVLDAALAVRVLLRGTESGRGPEKCWQYVP